jgi:hypothetical protein
VGLLSEHRPHPRKRIFLKTPLWPVVLSLETDSRLSAFTRH